MKVVKRKKIKNNPNYRESRISEVQIIEVSLYIDVYIVTI
jgi:hypothetical protein